MKLLYKFLLFAIFFNMGLFFISYINFFPCTFYGDVTTYGLENAENLPTAETMFTRLITNLNGEVASFAGFHLTFGFITGTLIVIGLGASFLAQSTTPIALLLVGSLFTIMWANSKRVIDSLTSGLDSSVNYLILMVAVGVLIVFIIEIADVASGQRSAD